MPQNCHKVFEPRIVLVTRQKYETRASARHSIFEYIKVFYNRERLHSSLGYQSPEMFEQAV